ELSLTRTTKRRRTEERREEQYFNELSIGRVHITLDLGVRDSCGDV
ncbi:8368_t:CDS:2, partial [Diversispora eburnea]